MSDTEIILVRHGQANAGAKTEEDYDRLSDMGHQQARWLGDYFRDQGQQFDRVICGDLRRHRETVAGIAPAPDMAIDPRVNEMRYLDLASELERLQGLAMPQDHLEFIDHLPKTMAAWHSGILDHVHTPLQIFREQFADVIAGCMAKGGRSLIVTSGGVIGHFAAACVGLPPDAAGSLILPIRNTSVHSIIGRGDVPALLTFNGTPHLDIPSRVHARSFI